MRDRVAAYVNATPGQGLPGTLVQAALRALEAVDERDGQRAAALDLLAADALITLALLAQAEQDPARLHDFAAALLTSGPAAA